MYKVFYKDRTVFFVDHDQNLSAEADASVHFFTNRDVLKTSLTNFLSNPALKNLYVVHENIEYVFNEFIKLYKLIEASGGLVKNNNNEFLFIYRREKWDLPKGKLEKTESPEAGAIREVEEECGITELEIKNLIEITYHTYNLKEKDILKRTYWFEMLSKGTKNPKPQTEEEITEAKWINADDLSEVLNNTFPSIIEVLKKANIVKTE
ncbi:MAG TPA: NUDIX hydrolase [Bacteroidales bacterium]|jgi:8-oxo-dGTP pyrophosphatase MutT (NUDIX family)|nr:NUDIX hydrolase [Bacteroidales bacterium]